MTYHLLLLPLIAGLITQTSKFALQTNKQKLNFKNLLAYSGMPSSHSSMIVSLATIIGLETGFGSAYFAISFIIALIILRDAMGLRRYLGQHGKILNILVKDLGDDQVLEQKYPHLLENIGHTPAQVLVGALTGLLVSLVGYYFFK